MSYPTYDSIEDVWNCDVCGSISHVCIHHYPQFSGEYQRGRDDERAAIIRYITGDPQWTGKYTTALAKAIENGAHDERPLR